MKEEENSSSLWFKPPVLKLYVSKKNLLTHSQNDRLVVEKILTENRN